MTHTDNYHLYGTNDRVRSSYESVFELGFGLDESVFELGFGLDSLLCIFPQI